MRPGVGLAAVALDLVCVVPAVAVHVVVDRIAHPVPVVVGWLGEAAPPKRAARYLLGVGPAGCRVLVGSRYAGVIVIGVGVNAQPVVVVVEPVPHVERQVVV